MVRRETNTDGNGIQAHEGRLQMLLRAWPWGMTRNKKAFFMPPMGIEHKLPAAITSMDISPSILNFFSKFLEPELLSRKDLVQPGFGQRILALLKAEEKMTGRKVDIIYLVMIKRSIVCKWQPDANSEMIKRTISIRNKSCVPAKNKFT
ncbi:unnamed protein product, partial [Nesidiocoris tenuis]